MTHAQHFRTIREARGAMALDYGFDPFTVGQAVRGEDGQLYRRPTKAAMAATGYPVMTAAERREEKTEITRRETLPELHLSCWADDCGGREGDGELWDYECTLVGRPSEAARDYQRRFPHLGLPSHLAIHEERLGCIPARSRDEARRIAEEKFAGRFSRIVFDD